MSIILEQDEIEDPIKAASNIKNKISSQSKVTIQKKYKKGNGIKSSKGFAIEKEFRKTKRDIGKKVVSKFSPVEKDLNIVLSIEKETKTHQLIKIKQLIKKNNHKDNSKDNSKDNNYFNKDDNIYKEKEINHSQLLNDYQNRTQSQRKLIPIKIIKPEANQLMLQINQFNLISRGTQKNKIVIDIKNHNRSGINHIAQSSKVKLSNVKNMISKKKIIESPKEVFVDIRIQMDSNNSNQNDDTSSLYNATNNNWNRSFYPRNNMKLMKDKMNQIGNGAKFALNNYDRFSDDLLSMRKTIGCFNRLQFQNFPSNMIHSSQYFFNPYDEHLNSEKYPMFFLPTQGKGLLLQSNTKI